MRTLLFLLLLAPIVLSGQKISRQAAEKDVRALSAILFNEHPAPTAYISRDSLDRFLRNMTRFDGDSIGLHQWEWRIRELLIWVGCGHTYVYRNKNLQVNPKPRIFPYDIFYDDKKVWIVASFDSVSPSPLPSGAEILAVNGIPIDQIIQRIRRHQSSDGYNQSLGYRLVNKDMFFSYLMRKYIIRDTSLLINWRDTSGRQQLDTIIALTEKQMLIQPISKDTTIKVLYRTKKNRQYFYFHPQHPEIAVLKLNSFSGRGKPLYRKAFRTMDKQHTPYLVIDVRDNLGGNFESCVHIARRISRQQIKMELSRKLFRTWRYQPFKTVINRIGALFLFDVVNVNPRWIKKGRVYYRLKYRPIKRHHFDGQVFVLTNGWSFSASSLMATYLQEQTNAVLIGQETGGGARSNNGMQIPKFVLPGSKIAIKVPQMNIQYGLGPDIGRGVMPDIPIQYTLKDVVDKRDLEWEMVLQQIQALKHQMNN